MPMRLWSIAAGLLLAIGVDASGQAYKWIDKQGRVHYTQTPPPPDARAVQMRAFRGGPTEAVDLPYATRLASQNFPVTLYTWPDCGPPCDLARGLLVKRAVPFREVSILTQDQADEMKKRTGRENVPTLVVGSQVQGGFHEGIYNGILDAAGYPLSAAPLPIEALRKMGPDARAPGAARSQPTGGTGATTDSETVAR